MRELPDATIIDGRYRVISRIGSGGMADVYCAEDLQLGRRVAVKLLHQRFAEDTEFVERFRREAKSAASLSHPNIVSVFDRGEWDGTYYIAMEYLPGRSLKELVREQGAMAPLAAIEITTQVLQAARFAHQRNVIHRDLKPLNVIIDDEGRVKVTDFGIARAGASEITQAGSIMGTAQYLSPEQAQGHEVHPQSDLYSIGILLYELLTGHVPFDGESAVAIALKQIGEMPPPPSTINPMVSPPLDAIVMKALAKDPAERFNDADEFLAALESERSALRLAPEPQTRELAAAAAAYGSAAGGFAPPSESYVEESGAYPQQEWEPLADPPRGRAVWPWVLLAVIVAALIAGGALLLLTPSKHSVPDVIGQNVSNAEAELTAAGFQSDPFEIESSAPQGNVVGQNPQAGSSASKGTLIQLTVSNGPGSKQIPDMTGQTLAAARHALGSAGFQVTVTQQASTAVPAGSVITTNPTPLQTAPVGSVVVLTVSSGPPAVTVPDVSGKSQADASTILTAAGFKVATTTQPSSTTLGTVLTQTPLGGASAPQGSTVAITLAAPLTTVSVPGLVGQSAVDAATTLGADQLKAVTTQQDVTIASQNGVVLSQSPKSGSSVKPGTAVTLVVGQYSGATGATSDTGATGAATVTP